MTSNHVHTISVWKSLETSSVRSVASCVCVSLKLERAFSTRSSPSALYDVDLQLERVRLQCQKCSSPTQNSFVASDKHVRLHCDSYLKESSKDYLVASNERVRLQCKIIFGDVLEKLSRRQR